MKNEHAILELLGNLTLESGLQLRIQELRSSLLIRIKHETAVSQNWIGSGPGQSLILGVEQLYVHLRLQEERLQVEAGTEEIAEDELIAAQYLLEGTAKAVCTACIELARMDGEHKLYFIFALDELTEIRAKIKALYNPVEANLANFFAPMP